MQCQECFEMVPVGQKHDYIDCVMFRWKQPMNLGDIQHYAARDMAAMIHEVKRLREIEG